MDRGLVIRRSGEKVRDDDSNGGCTLDLGQPVTGIDSLDGRIWRELTSGDVGSILTQLHYRTIVNIFIRQNDQLATWKNQGRCCGAVIWCDIARDYPSTRSWIVPFCTFPIALRGRDSKNITSFGHL